MKSIRQLRIFGGKDKDKDRDSISVAGAPASVSRRRQCVRQFFSCFREPNGELIFSKRVFVFLIMSIVGFIITLRNELREERFDRDDPLVGSNSYYAFDSISEGESQKPTQTVKLAGSGILKGVLIKEEGAEKGKTQADRHYRKGKGGPVDDHVLENVYHLLGGPKRVDKTDGVVSSTNGEKNTNENNGHGRSRRSGASNLDSKKDGLPNLFLSPWQWGLRSPKQYGGGDDEEVLQHTQLGTPQPLVSEAVFAYDDSNGIDAGSHSSESVKGITAQVKEISRRYYDSSDLLQSFQYVMSNQRGFRGEKILPVQEARASEDELPIPYRW